MSSISRGSFRGPSAMETQVYTADPETRRGRAGPERRDTILRCVPRTASRRDHPCPASCSASCSPSSARSTRSSIPTRSSRPSPSSSAGSWTTASSTSSCPAADGDPRPRLRRGLRLGHRRPVPHAAGGGDRGIGGGARASRSSCPTSRRTRATSRSSPESWRRWRSRSINKDRLVGRPQHRRARRRRLHPGRADRPPGAGQPPRGGDRERDPLPRDALVRGPPRHALRDRQGDGVHPRPRRAAPARGRDRQARDRLRDVRHPAPGRGPPGAGAAQVRSTSAPPRRGAGCPVSEGLCGAAVRSKEPILVGDVRQDPRYVSLIPETRSELVVPLVHKDRVVGRLRPRVAGARPLHRGARQGAHARWPARWRSRSRTRGSTRSSARTSGACSASSRSPRTSSTALFPEESPGGPGLGGLRPLPPGARAGRRPLRLLRHGRRAPGRWPSATWPGKGVPAALYGAFASGTVRARAFERRSPADLMQRVNRTLRRRGVEGLFCTLGVRALRLRGPDGPHRQLGPALPAPLPRGQRALRAPRGGRPAPGRLRRRRPTTRPLLDLAPGDVFVFHTDGVTRRPERARGVRRGAPRGRGRSPRGTLGAGTGREDPRGRRGASSATRSPPTTSP